MVASNAKLSFFFDQMAAPIPEIMDGYLYAMIVLDKI
jgi:hypothetical protein